MLIVPRLFSRRPRARAKYVCMYTAVQPTSPRERTRPHDGSRATDKQTEQFLSVVHTYIPVSWKDGATAVVSYLYGIQVAGVSSDRAVLLLLLGDGSTSP